MTPPHPIQQSLPLDRQYLAVFTERRNAITGATPCPAHPCSTGGLQAAGVFHVYVQVRTRSPLEGVSAWVQSLGHWKPQARRFHDTLVRTYLVALGIEPVMDSHFPHLYWMASACNTHVGDLRYHRVRLEQARTPTKQATTLTIIQQWLRVNRCADVCWHAG